MSSPGTDSSPRPSGLSGVLRQLSTQKIEAALWGTRVLTILYTLSYIFPILGGQPSAYFGKALLSNAATSALRLHQRISPGRLSWRELLGQVLLEDSAHYLGFSLIFYFGCLETVSLVLVPVFMFALLHASSYTLTLLDILSPGPMWIKKIIVQFTKNFSSDALRIIALSEIFIMPLTVVFVLTGKVIAFTPYPYFKFLSYRYASRRNPYSKNMFQELRIFLEQASDKIPASLRSLVHKAIQIISGMAPIQN
eukprot:TRINITY_DN870_c0_g2_i1.p1 TRINITY_DN870_c0_g2~~TRINITY_DN870_c0_g2_i1.p1  ORF type:complete len:252 (+),score=85.03 TRINITY_DN870_c0_g2_i1:110-865(+)